MSINTTKNFYLFYIYKSLVLKNLMCILTLLIDLNMLLTCFLNYEQLLIVFLSEKNILQSLKK